MNLIEKTYRLRRRMLYCAFICSVFLFFVLCYPKPWGFGDPLFFQLVFKIASGVSALLFLVLFTRYVHFKAFLRKDPSLRNAVDDERIKTNWLRSYRAAFFVMVGIHFIWMFSESMMFDIGLPHAAWISSTAGLMTFFGAAVFFTREAK